jgi:hypothetical protein
VSDKRVDTIGRAQFTRKSTQAEIDRRAGLIAKHYRRGHSIEEIVEALGISDDQVRRALRDIFPNRPRRTRGRGRIIEPCPWRDEDMPLAERGEFLSRPEPRWRRSQIVGMAQMLNDEYRESNFANILANQVTDAESAGDAHWPVEALAIVSAAIEKLERARRVLTDDSYRAACRDTLEGVEQMRHKHPPLRALP